MSNIIVMAFSPRNIVGCLLKKGLQRGGETRAPQDPPRYALVCFSEKIIHEINTLFYSFVWNGKGDKIKLSVMINDYAEGGLK